MEHFPCFLIVGDFIRKHTVIDKPGTAYRLSKKYPLFGIGHCPKLVRFVHKITNFQWILQTNYTIKEGNMQGGCNSSPTYIMLNFRAFRDKISNI